MTVYHYLIIGNGAAGMSAAEMIRQRDPAGQITIVTNEPYHFYSRPGIAYYIMDQIPESQLITRGDSFYRSHRLNLHFGHVSRLDLEAKLVFLDDGQPLAYDVLLLATGATAVPAPFPGGHLEGVLTFDTMDDAKKVVKEGRRAKTAVVVGGGITAMELAEGFSHQGARTLLLQRGDRIWPRLFDEQESAIVESQIRHEGISVLYNEEISEVVGKRGKVIGVRLKSGRAIKCQVVAVAIGVRPNMSLVEDLAIEKDKGILVNDFLQSSQPSLFAAGDVAQVYDRWTGQHQLDILWPSAINEGRAAGINMVDVAHGQSPSFNYLKGSPFNCALLFGLHLTVIGRVGTKENGDVDQLQYLSRGSSHIWTAPFITRFRSAWDKDGLSSLRIVMADGQIVGALLIGNQELADPLRRFIEQEVDLSNYESQLTDGQAKLPQTLLQAWHVWNQRWS